MGLFRRKREQAPEMVPVNMMAVMMDAFGMAPADAYSYEAPQWETREEHEAWLVANPPPSIPELLQDPDVRVVLEAHLGKTAFQEMLARN